MNDFLVMAGWKPTPQTEILHWQAGSLPHFLIEPLGSDLPPGEHPMEDGIVRRRRLPHVDVEGATYFVTACLEGSLSTTGLLKLADYRNELSQRPRPAEFSTEEWK